jgi:acyl carrier protein
VTKVGEPAIDRKRAELLEQLLHQRRAAQLGPAAGEPQRSRDQARPTEAARPTGMSVPVEPIEQGEPATSAQDDARADEMAHLLRAELAAIWTEVFGVPASRYTEDQSFFEIGGTSIQAVRLRARIQDSFGIELELAEIFAGGSVAELAASLEAVLAGTAGENGAAQVEGGSADAEGDSRCEGATRDS